MHPDPYVVQPGEAELRWLGETSTHFLATGASTGGEFGLVDERAKQGESVPLHRHAEDVESFYVLAGEASFFLGDGQGVRAVAAGYRPCGVCMRAEHAALEGPPG